MRTAGPVLAILAAGWGLLAQAPDGGVAHMRYLRQVVVTAGDRPHYVVIDEEMWARARRDLADLRLQRADGRPVPYALRAHGEERRADDVRARILQPGRLGGATRFSVAIPDEVEEFERVRLELKTRNFVAAARLEGADGLTGHEWVDLGQHRLFDFSREQLGAASLLELPPTRFRYLRVTITGEVAPGDVTGAYIPRRVRREAQWMALAVTPDKSEEPGRTVFRWRAANHVPVERLRVHAGADAENFIRRVELLVDGRPAASGTIRRLSRRHSSGLVRVDELEVPVPGAHGERFEAIVHHGDDAPLPEAAVTPLAVERRLYFDAPGASDLTLYFGDPESTAPEYDFARLFSEEAAAAPARLVTISGNPAYRPRPDLRPWSERNPSVLGMALALAVLVLGGLAVRALRTA